MTKNSIDPGKRITELMEEKQLSTYEVERRSEKTIDQSYVSKIMNNRVKPPSINRQAVLAKGLGVPKAEIFSIFNGAGSATDVAQTGAYYVSALPENVQNDVLSDVEALYKQHVE